MYTYYVRFGTYFSEAKEMDKVQKHRAFIINTVYAVIVIGLFYLCIKYALD